MACLRRIASAFLNPISRSEFSSESDLLANPFSVQIFIDEPSAQTYLIINFNMEDMTFGVEIEVLVRPKLKEADIARLRLKGGNPKGHK